MTAPRSTTLTRPADTREGMGRDEWREKAACAPFVTAGIDLWFPGEHERPDARDRRVQDAKDVCAGCPVRDACLAYAMDREGSRHAHLRGGIYGGLTPEERASIARAARRKG